MKTKELKELRTKEIKDLKKALIERQKEQMEKNGKKLRREIAQILTIIKEREIVDKITNQKQ